MLIIQVLGTIFAGLACILSLCSLMASRKSNKIAQYSLSLQTRQVPNDFSSFERTGKNCGQVTNLTGFDIVVERYEVLPDEDKELVKFTTGLPITVRKGIVLPFIVAEVCNGTGVTNVILFWRKEGERLGGELHRSQILIP